ncbi:hypothetical protein ACP70R_012080 [Stipagrostis hirtigluma subsp. patula]
MPAPAMAGVETFRLLSRTPPSSPLLLPELEHLTNRFIGDPWRGRSDLCWFDESFVGQSEKMTLQFRWSLDMGSRLSARLIPIPSNHCKGFTYQVPDDVLCTLNELEKLADLEAQAVSQMTK